MDCEGFQDLNQWCGTKSFPLPQSPDIDTNYGRYYIQESLENENHMKSLFEGAMNGHEESIDIFAQPSNINIYDDNAQMDGVFSNDILISDISNEQTIQLSNDSDIVCHIDEYNKTNMSNEKIYNYTNELWNDVTEVSQEECHGLKMQNNNVMLSSTSEISTPASNTLTRVIENYPKGIQNNNNSNQLKTELLSSNAEKNNFAVVSAFILKNDSSELKLKISPEVSSVEWIVNTDINTPDVLMAVDELENERQMRNTFSTNNEPTVVAAVQKIKDESPAISMIDFTPPDTPQKPVRKRRRQDSEDSDTTYIPDQEYKPTPKKPRNPRISYMTKVYLDQLATPSRRGRPPKRRESNSSSGTFNDDNHSIISSEDKYKDQRERNNEASRRSRFNRKLKEMDMENKATLLEERNKYLRIKEQELVKKRDLLKKYLFNAITAK